MRELEVHQLHRVRESHEVRYFTLGGAIPAAWLLSRPGATPQIRACGGVLTLMLTMSRRPDNAGYTDAGDVGHGGLGASTACFRVAAGARSTPCSGLVRYRSSLFTVLCGIALLLGIYRAVVFVC
jgi:hypothetical protein